MTPEPETSSTRSVGFVGLAGMPNVGKSTLVNRLVGQKVSIVSDRVQTTRQRVCGIYTDRSVQAILVDIPGILKPADTFNETLMDCAARGLEGCDLVWHLRDAHRPNPMADAPVVEMIRRSRKPVWLIWNKIDRLKGNPLPAQGKELTYERVIGLSARTGRGVDQLIGALGEALPKGPLLYDADQVCDRDLRFMVAELVREKIFRYLGREVPYATTTVTDQFDETRGGKLYIRIVIYTEREAHKPILIGKNGAMLKKVGEKARPEIEALCGRPVYLELWVKVRPKWRKNDYQLTQLGLK